MADSSRTKRRRLTLIGSAAAALALSVSLAPGAAAAGPPDSSPGASKAAAAQAPWSAEPVTVMTRNLYLGADLMPVITSLTYDPSTWPEDVPAPPPPPVAAAQTWAAVVATHPAERMAAVAEEIATHAPAVVGLQEVTEWWTYTSYNPTTGAASGQVEVYDFLDLLLQALAAEGVSYQEVEGATAHNFASGPIPMLTPTGLGAVAMADRDVIIKRSDVSVANPHTGQFENIIRFPIAGVGLLPVKRGWGSADVDVDGTEFRFVNAHLEAFGIPGVDAESLRVAQVKELLAAQDQITAEFGDLPDVYVGDYNSAAPTGAAYRELRKDLRDAWLPGNGMADGDTCCQAADLANATSILDERIDLVLIEDQVRPVETELVGDYPIDLTGDVWWASDHAGVVAELLIKR